MRSPFVPIARLGAIAGILVLALVLRLALAPSPGYVPDVTINRGWAFSGAELGVARSYEQQLVPVQLPNYPPLGLAAFVAVGKLWQRFGPPEERAGPPSTAAIKLPAIVFDLATTILLYALLRRVLGERSALLGAFLHAVHPAVLYDSAVWGQVDSIFTSFVLAAFAARAGGRPVWAPPLLALGLACKLQAVIFVPLIGLLLLGRPRALGAGILAALGVTALVLAPFAFDPGAREAVLRVYTRSVGFYPTLSLSSYNLWRLLFDDAAGFTSDHTLLFGVIEYRRVGLVLFGAAYLFVVLSLRKSLWPRGRETALTKLAPLLAAGLVVSAFDLFCTEMHERYLYPAMVLGLPLVFFGTRGLVLYGLHSLCFLLNLVGALPWTPVDRALFAEFPVLEVVVAAGKLLVFFAILRYVLELQRRSGGEIAGGRERDLDAPAGRPSEAAADEPAGARRPEPLAAP